MASATGLVILFPALSMIFTICLGDFNSRDPLVLCNGEGCYVVYFVHRTFLESWKSCRGKGGNLATLKHPKEAEQVQELFSQVELWEQRELHLWIGLQRQPRQCSTTHRLRGFTWTTGDLDTEYTNWLNEDSSGACSVSRCVAISYSTRSEDRFRNFKWIDRQCSLPVEGFLCHYSYKGMCPALKAEESGPPVYNTPFKLQSTSLVHVPIGSLASIPCIDSSKGIQKVFCMLNEDGNVDWSRNGPYCSSDPPDMCEKNNGGCQHSCYNTGAHYYCTCDEGYKLAEDGKTCFLVDPCQSTPCEFQCVSGSEGYHCICPEGYLLASDNHSCRDEDECLQSPCQQLCVNFPGTFECHCSEGYRQDEFGHCTDIDECLNAPCEHNCENNLGSYVCYCNRGFFPHPDNNSRCNDIDECQLKGTCQQMCINYNGTFECYCKEGYTLQSDYSSCIPSQDLFITTVPGFFHWGTSAPNFLLSQVPDFNWLTDTTPPSWLTKLPGIRWLIDVKQEELPTTLPSYLFPDESTTDRTTSDRTSPTSTSSPSHRTAPHWYEDKSSETTLVFNSPTPAMFTESVNRNRTIQHDKYPTVGFPKTNFQDSPKKEVVPNASGSSSAPDHTPVFTMVTPLFPNQNNQWLLKNSNKWLLVGLIIACSIILLVLVVLCVFYRRRSTVKAHGKNTEDCYYWISGSGVKVDSANSTESMV